MDALQVDEIKETYHTFYNNLIHNICGTISQRDNDLVVGRDFFKDNTKANDKWKDWQTGLHQN